MASVVIGADIIGTAIAHDLQKRGRQVIPVDRDAPGNGVSFGNMASITVIEFMPASRPSVRWQIPGWMLDAEGPVRVRVHCAGEIGRFITGGGAGHPRQDDGREAAPSEQGG